STLLPLILPGRPRPSSIWPGPFTKRDVSRIGAACAVGCEAEYSLWGLSDEEHQRQVRLVHDAAMEGESSAQSDLLRDIIDNPFRPITLDPTCRTQAVVQLAKSLYEGRHFEDMPVLADALEEAGCTNPAILGHCRGPGPHVRGCWVLDLVLGKE